MSHFWFDVQGWLFVFVCWCFVVVCGCLLLFCGGLWLFAGGLWLLPVLVTMINLFEVEEQTIGKCIKLCFHIQRFSVNCFCVSFNSLFRNI